MIQQPLFVPTESGEQPYEPIEARLRHRTDDPATSKAAARVGAKRVSQSLEKFLVILDAYGPQTCVEAAQHTDDPSYWAFEFNRRVKEWSVAGYIALTGEERGGGRVWRAVQ